MKRAAILALLLGSCAFAQKHPGITVGIATGTIALVPCLPAVENPLTCLAIGAAAGVAIGGLTGLVTTFVDTSAHQLPPDEEPEEPIVREKKTTPPPPDAALDVAPPAVDAGVPVIVDAASAAP